MKKETLRTVGTSIIKHRESEYYNGSPCIGVARACCTLSSSNPKFPERNHVIWLTNAQSTPTAQRNTDSEITINKNSIVGGEIIMGVKGHRRYTSCGYTFGIDIFNFASYTPYMGKDAKDITIQFDGDDSLYKYQTLYELSADLQYIKESLAEEEKKKDILKEARKKAQLEEQAAREAALKAKEEERQRLEEEAKKLEEIRLKREEEERKNTEEIARLEAEYQEANQRAIRFRGFIRNEAFLRSQHILDPSQEKAKRSHLYDAVPLVIEGGPGTGKTTTMIQRLKFLLDVDALNDYESPLTKDQKRELVDNISEKWLFFSPSPLLLRFLMNNMNTEGLSATEGRNIITTLIPQHYNLTLFISS